VDDLITWLRAQLAEDEGLARMAFAEHNKAIVRWSEPWSGTVQIGPHEDDLVCFDSGVSRHIVNWDPARALAEVDAKRRILDEHAAQWRTVEWPHDQDGKGNALVCRRCQNAEHSEWNPLVGHAGVLPEVFVTPYVLAPCTTVLLLALPYADRAGYREEWRP
jgi:hypothetical protein